MPSRNDSWADGRTAAGWRESGRVFDGYRQGGGQQQVPLAFRLQQARNDGMLQRCCLPIVGSAHHGVVAVRLQEGGGKRREGICGAGGDAQTVVALRQVHASHMGKEVVCAAAMAWSLGGGGLWTGPVSAASQQQAPLTSSVRAAYV